MLHKFRRFFVVTLCLALACCLSVTAFAASSFSLTEPYDDDQTFVNVSAFIQAYVTYGGIDVDTGFGDPYTEASVSCRYLDNSYEMQFEDDYISGYYSSVACVVFNSDAIYHMVDAYYHVWAEVPTSYYWQEFEINGIYIEYEVQ